MSKLPAPVQRLIDATNAGDSAAFAAAFAPEAVLIDWGKEFAGAEAIAEWNESDNIGRDSRFRVVGVERDGEAHLVRIAVSGKGFNGESFFRFTVADELISRLEIAP
ncbi:MAG: ketosteroid isomerase [Leifsonia sp.]|nr:ketosteroid isomerase [Leifsonia sp.]|tara:strand:+ start:20069 stop:20389 length:321 start_codon:yes stop_codon:yes gene_type:complete